MSQPCLRLMSGNYMYYYYFLTKVKVGSRFLYFGYDIGLKRSLTKVHAKQQVFLPTLFPAIIQAIED